MRSLILISFLLLSSTAFVLSQKHVDIYPTNWYVGFNNPKLQLMIHGEGIGKTVGSITVNYPGVKIEKISHPENANYIFLDINVSPTTRSGTLHFTCRSDGKLVETIPYELRSRHKENGISRVLGVTSSDLIYFIMPDRFSNGDTSNDFIPGMLEQPQSRDSLKGRHGGDLAGVQQHLDYIKDLGATTIWLTPVLVNDMPKTSYHGYAFTDHYTIDPRFGGEKAYHSFIDAAHNKGLKVIQDAVYNHVGLQHVTVKDPPMKDWLNQWDHYQNTSYKDQTLMDPYASAIDKKIMTDGWFEPNMPDINQRNPFVANYLIQHALWTTENFGVDGWRIDTYAYCDREFMNHCNAALLNEFPQLGIFAETWVHGESNQSFFARNVYQIPFKSNLPGVTDFQVHFAMDDALNQEFGWMEGFSSLYSTLSRDFIYQDPYKNCVFLDNHDMNRFYSTVGKDIRKYKMGINWLLTLRGIPELYYGTEILMSGTTNPSDALVRRDFPGGWKNDSTNKFTASGRNSEENEAFGYVKTLANFRKNSSALKTGKMMQFVPVAGTYIYFRYDQNQTILVASNSNDKEATIKIDRFGERTNGYNKMKNVITGSISSLSDFSLPAKGSGVFELLK